MEKTRIQRLLLVYIVTVLVSNEVLHGEEYLVTYPTDNGSADLWALTINEGSWVQVQSKPRQNLTSYVTNAVSIDTSMRTIYGIENKAVIVRVSDDNVSIFGKYFYGIFSPLPVSALGTKYIVSTCHTSTVYTSVLVIATHSQSAEVDITFRLEGSVTYDSIVYNNGDNLTLTLQEYQTFTIGSDFALAGTIVAATKPVAVFTGTTFSLAIVYDQLLPVQHYGQEYIVAVDDDPAMYELQIVSDNSDTYITFNNGSTLSVDENGYISQVLTQNTSLHFSSTSPVMATLCRYNADWSSFTVVPPVTLFPRQTTFLFLGLNSEISGILKVLVGKDVNDIVIRTSSTTLPGQWEDIPDTGYKVGTWEISSNVAVSVTSEAKFTPFVFSSFTMFNGGYQLPSLPITDGNTKFTCSKTWDSHYSSSVTYFTIKTLTCILFRSNFRNFKGIKVLVFCVCLLLGVLSVDPIKY